MIFLKFIIVFFFLPMSIDTYASLSELFSGAASTMAIGNQPTESPSDPANNAMAPALLALSKENSFSFNFFGLSTDFDKMNNIVVDNSLNSTNGTRTDDYNPNPSAQYLVGVHGAINFLRNGNAKLLVSLYAPADKVIEVNTGDPYRPEYIIYKSRLQRTIIDFHMANQWNKNLSYSIGFHTGLQSAGETKVIARETGTPVEPSSGSLKVNATPSLSPIVSLVYNWNPTQRSYFYWQKSMKSQLKNEATGLTPVGSSALRFDWDFKSMLYFDPTIIRLGHQVQFSKWHYYISLEYQDWSEYKTPKLEMVNNGGILTGSFDYEKVELKNTLTPKLGSSYRMGDSTLSFGYFRKQTPFEHDFNLAGNSIDADAHVFGLGYSTLVNWGENTFTLNTAGQYHLLDSTKVTKTPNMEDGSSGSKVGAPGYTVGGKIYVLSFGLSWVL